MQKPDAINHMIGYGFVYGFLLAMIYTITIFRAYYGIGINLTEIIVTIAIATFSSFFMGGILGAVFGLVQGTVLQLTTRHIEPPFDLNKFQQLRILTFVIVSMLTLFGMSYVILPLAQFQLTLLSTPGILDFIRFNLPIPIATFASIYAVHRYFLKLRAWGNVGKAKNKAKPGLTNQLADEDAEAWENYAAEEAVVKQQHK